MEVLHSMRSKNGIRVWSLTINSPDPNSKTMSLSSSELSDILKKVTNQFVFALELGEQNSRLHYQAIIHLKERTRAPYKIIAPYVDKSTLCYWQFQPAKDINALKNYCTKSPIDGEVCRFTRDFKAVPLFDAINLRPLQQQIIDIVERERDSRSVFVFSDSEGNSGKSTLIKHYLNTQCAVFAPSVGTPDSISNSIVQQLTKKLADPTTQNRCIYLLFDITHTSNLMKSSDKRNNFASICESAVTGLLSCSFQGKTTSFYAESGKVCPIIMTNFEPNDYKNLFSQDRNHIFYLHEDEWREA